MGTYEIPRGGAQALACRDVRSRLSRPPFPKIKVSLPSLPVSLRCSQSFRTSHFGLRISYFAPVAQTAPIRNPDIPDSQSANRPHTHATRKHFASLRLSSPLSASFRFTPLRPATLCPRIVQFWQNVLCTCKMPFRCLWLRLKPRCVVSRLATGCQPANRPKRNARTYAERRRRTGRARPYAGLNKAFTKPLRRSDNSFPGPATFPV